MRLSRILFPALLGCAMVSAVAQDQTRSPLPPSQAASDSAPPYQASPIREREWVPEGIIALGQNATSRTEFTLDHTMLVLASKLDQDNADLQRVIAGIKGVSVHSFRFPVPVYCDPATMEFIRRQYRAAGWQHLVSNHKNHDVGTTDLWIRMDHAAIRDIAVLFTGVKAVNFVSVSGSIAPLDLLRLSGHFGIPRMDGGVVVPVPDRDR